MKKYEIRVLVNLSTAIEVEAENQKEAINIASKEFMSGELMGEDIFYNEYYDGYSVDIESEEEI